jgi:hypothetical protein
MNEASNSVGGLRDFGLKLLRNEFAMLLLFFTGNGRRI